MLAFNGVQTLYPPSLGAFLQYDIVILGFPRQARSREVLTHGVAVLRTTGVSISCGLPPLGLTPGFLWAVIQGQDCHTLRLIIYVVGS